MRGSYAFATGGTRFLAGMLYGLRYEGLEHVPSSGACLIAANHKSYIDPPVVGSGPRRELRFFAKKELFSIPLLGPYIHHLGAIPVDRTGFDRSGITRALELLARGEALVLFPEGTRIARPGYGEPREGVGLLALQAGVPVVPCHVSSAWEPRRSIFRRIPIVVRYGPPLHFGTRAKGPERRAQYAEVARAVMDAIRALSVAGNQKSD